MIWWTPLYLSIPYLQSLEPELQILHFVQVLEYLYIYDEISWPWAQVSSMKFTYVSYKSCIHSLKVFVVCLAFDCRWACEVRCGLFHSWHMSVLKKLYFGSILDFWIRDAQPILQNFKERTLPLPWGLVYCSPYLPLKGNHITIIDFVLCFSFCHSSISRQHFI